MKRIFPTVLSSTIICVILLTALPVRGGERILSNPNLAYQARVEADSIYDQSYGAQGAVDGRVVEPKSGDVGAAWAVRAPLSRAAGGLGVCEEKSGKPVFTSVEDEDYLAILNAIKRGRQYILEEDNRPEMLIPSENNGRDCPQKYVPRWPYLREMIRYGLLPYDADPNASYNPYELDEIYWESLHYKVPQSADK